MKINKWREALRSLNNFVGLKFFEDLTLVGIFYLNTGFYKLRTI